MAQVVVWGGEPLLRQDLPELLRAARDAGLFVTAHQQRLARC